MRTWIAVVTCLLVTAGCKAKPERDTSGTPGNPVEVCKRSGDVCTTGSSQLGVCTNADSSNPRAVCDPEAGCFVCAPQH
ncbi:MAG: hypothetical protein KJO07_07760 [Deltaproteobacteria bacterium]|nr:hypothetical protein [Deltaproteobacteria bacterium]